MLRPYVLLLTLAKTPKLQLPKVKIRSLTAKDLPAVQALWKHTKGVEMDEGDSLPNLRGFLRRNRGASHLAVGNGKAAVGSNSTTVVVSLKLRPLRHANARIARKQSWLRSKVRQPCLPIDWRRVRIAWG